MRSERDAKAASVARAVAGVALVASLGASACGVVLNVDDFGPAGGPVPSSPSADGGAASASPDGSASARDGAVRDAAPASECPGTGGPAAVRVPVGSGSFCIDTTEVTKGDYARFLATGAAPSQAQAGLAPPTGCAWNASFTPSSGWPPSAADERLPVAFVDWCDAYAFCAWSGKRLCGRIGGGASAPDKLDEESRSQWYAACSQGGAQRFPYGDAFAARSCNGPQAFNRTTTLAGGLPTCEGGYPGIFDMSGNVREWEDSCNAGGGGEGSGGPNGGATDGCNVRGGGFDSPSVIPNLAGDDVACDTNETAARSAAQASIGFRCCSP